MKTVALGPYSIDIHNRAGVVVSGGADSSILLYIMMKYSTTPLTVYTLASKEKFRSAARVSSNVIDKCMELTGQTTVYHKLIYVDRQNNDLLFEQASQDLRNNQIKIIYTGLTKLPPLPVLEGFKNTVDNYIMEERNPNKQYNEYTVNNKCYMPFYNLDKRQIFEIYQQFDLVDDLFPITRSCESLRQSTGHCGECWWCEERQWAFGRLE